MSTNEQTMDSVWRNALPGKSRWFVLRILGEKQAGFWKAWNNAFQKIILNQVLEWLPIAVMGGALVGFVVWRLSIIKASGIKK